MTGSGGSGNKLRAEFSKEKHVRGTLSMARTSDPNSADSQFFIMFAPAPSLDNQYTIWGEVVSGMEYVDKIKKGEPGRNGSVTNPDKIVKMQVAADADKGGAKGKTTAYRHCEEQSDEAISPQRAAMRTRLLRSARITSSRRGKAMSQHHTVACRPNNCHWGFFDAALRRC